MKRQQTKERIDVHVHDSMLSTLLVHLVVIGNLRVGHVLYSGIGDGHAVGIAPDVFEHLTDSLSRRLGIYDPVFVEALLAGGLRDKKSLLLQPACQQIHETPTELTAHGSDGEEKRGASTAMYLMPYTISVNSSAGYNAVDMGVVKKIRSPRMEDGCHTSLESLIVGKSINSAPCGLEHTVVELSLIGHRYRMQTVGQRENDMEVLDGDDFLPAEVNPLLTLLLLTLWTMTVTTTIIADMDFPTLRTNLYMPAQGTGTALCHVSEGSLNCRYDMMLAQKFSTVAPDNLTDVETSPHRFGGNMVSISRTCLIGSMLAT